MTTIRLLAHKRYEVVSLRTLMVLIDGIFGSLPSGNAGKRKAGVKVVKVGVKSCACRLDDGWGPGIL